MVLYAEGGNIVNMVYQVPTLRLSLCLSPIKGDSLCLPFSQMVIVDERTPRNTLRYTPHPPKYPSTSDFSPPPAPEIQPMERSVPHAA